jgi:flagella basal body P-ring formation protein FlgA
MNFANPLFRGIVGGVLGALTLPAAAFEAMQPLDSIQTQVREFLLTQHKGQAEPPEIQVSPLDPRLRLAACGEKLTVFLPNGVRPSGSTVIRVRCPGPQPWTIHLSANVQSFGKVLVADRFLPRGTIFTAADLRTERRDLTTLPGGYETVPANLIGKQLRCSLPSGAVISPQTVITPPLIKRGERVVILAHQAGMEISSSGIALQDVGLGEQLQVRNESSKQVIEGKVIAAQRIEVEF